MKRAALWLFLAGSVSADGLKPGRMDPKNPPAGWTVLETKTYQVQSDAPKEKVEKLARTLEKALAAYRKLLPTDRAMSRFVVKFFALKKDFVEYGKHETSDGFWNPNTDELVGYDLEAEDARDPSRLGGGVRGISSFGILYHEAWHQYFHWYLGDKDDLPSWLDEGMGDYVSTAQEDGDEMRLGAVEPGRLQAIRGFLRDGKDVPFEKIVRYTSDDYYKDRDVCYAQGWAMVYFCMEGGNERYRDILRRFADSFRVSKKMASALDEALKGIDLASMQAEWKAFMLELK